MRYFPSAVLRAFPNVASANLSVSGVEGAAGSGESESFRGWRRQRKYCVQCVSDRCVVAVADVTDEMPGSYLAGNG